MAIAESGPITVGPSPQAARSTSSGSSRSSSQGAKGSTAFAALVNGMADRDQEPDDVRPGNDGRSRPGEGRPIDRRAKPASAGRSSSTTSSRPATTAEQTDDPKAAVGTRRSHHSKTASTRSERSSETADTDDGDDPVAVSPVPLQIDQRADAKQIVVVESLASTAPTPTGVPSAGAAPAATSQDVASSAGATEVGEQVDGLAAASASAEAMLSAVGAKSAVDAAALTAGGETTSASGPTGAAGTSGTGVRDAVHGRHSEVRQVALSALRDALAATTLPQQKTDGGNPPSGPVDSPLAKPANAQSALAAYSLADGPSVDKASGSKNITIDVAQAVVDEEALVSDAASSASGTTFPAISSEGRSTSEASSGVPSMMHRSALAGITAKQPQVQLTPSNLGTSEQATAVEPTKNAETAASVLGRIDQPTSTQGAADAKHAQGTLGAAASAAGSGAVADITVASQGQPERVDLARDTKDSAGATTAAATDTKPQAVTLSGNGIVDGPKEPARVAPPRRPHAGIAQSLSPVSGAATEKAGAVDPASQTAAVTATNAVIDGTSAPARQARQSSEKSVAAQDASELDAFEHQNLAAALTTATSTSSPARKTEVLTQAPQKPTGTAAIAIAAFQAAAAAAPDIHRSLSGTAGVASPAVLDAQLRTPIVDAIRVQAGKGDGQVRLRLNPEFLGDVTVDVRVNGGTVVASVQAANADVREWLRTNEAVLRQTLADQGLHLERFVIAEEETPPGREQPDQQHESASDQQREWERRSRRSRETGTFEVVL